MQSLSAVLLFFGNKKSSKSSIFFYSLIIEFLWFAWIWLKFEEKIQTKAIVNIYREEHRPCIRLKLPFHSLFNSLRRAPFSLAYTYVLVKILQNGAKCMQKLTPGFKNIIRNLDNFRQAVESPKKLKFDGLLLPKKFISSAKTLYTKDVSNITFNYLYENSRNFLCHFWNRKPFFTTQLLYIFLAQSLHSFEKSSPSKWKFSDFPLLTLKFTKFRMPFFKLKLSFS